MKAVNLLPADLRASRLAVATPSSSRPAPQGSGPFVLLGALALCVAALAVWVLARNEVRAQEAELAAATAQTQAASARAAQLKPYADFESLATARVQTVKDLAQARFDWEQSLRDLSRALPGEVTLASLNGTVASTASGGGGSQLRGAINAPAIELKGCTTSQRGVAALMSRLRNVDGVTRVSLSKSDKEGGAGAAAPTQGVGVTSDAGPCGEGSRPNFELVVFFERDAAASAAPTGPAPAQATPATATNGAAGATPSPQPAAGSAPAAATPAATPTTSGGTQP